jgi:hypothetical protein
LVEIHRYIAGIRITLRRRAGICSPVRAAIRMRMSAYSATVAASRIPIPATGRI